MFDHLPHHPLRLALTCPTCERNSFRPLDQFADTLLTTEGGVTTDCPHCDELLVYYCGSVYQFHEWMHARGPISLSDGTTHQWPKDGANTSYVDIGA